MKNIIAYRLRNARILKGYSMQEVANELQVSKQMISKYEKGLSVPNSSKLIILSRLYNLKIDYFFNSFKVDLGEVNFRKKSSLSIKRQNSLKEEIKIKLENYLFIEDILSIDYNFTNPVKKKIIKNIEDIEKTVSSLRNIWEIGYDPIHNIIQILEDQKIKVIEIDTAEANFDGLATYVNNKYPVIVLNKNFPVERKRFSLLHELGHLLLNIDSTIINEEEACNKFASEFLVPKKTLLNEFGGKRKHITYKELISIQEKYGVSIQAIVYKLVDIGILTKSQHTSFYKKLNLNHALKKEIDKSRFCTPEYSKRYDRLIYRGLSQEAISLSKAASLLNISIEEIKNNFEFI